MLCSYESVNSCHYFKHTKFQEAKTLTPVAMSSPRAQISVSPLKSLGQGWYAMSLKHLVMSETKWSEMMDTCHTDMGPSLKGQLLTEDRTI